MTISLVAHVAVPGSATGGTSSAIDTTGATLLVFHVADSDGSTTTVSDSKGNTWTALTGSTLAGVESHLYYCQNPTVGTGHTFTTSAGAAFPAGHVAAYSGTATASVFDVEEGHFANAGSSDTDPITPSQNNSLIVTGVAHAITLVPTVDSGFTVSDANALLGGVYYGGGLAYLIQTTAASVNPTWTTGSSGPIATTIAAFKAGAGGATGTSSTTNANDTSSASGTTTVTGTLARTNANDTSSASGTTTVTGTLAKTNANDTSSASGSVGSGVSGSAAVTNANDTSAAAGTTTVAGTLARANANDTAAASGTTTVKGSAATTNANDASSASGIVGSITGASATTNRNDVAAARGIVGIPITTVQPIGGGNGKRLEKEDPWPTQNEEEEVLMLITALVSSGVLHA